jgi:hybrid cluster-associated redox disulfide protein
MAVTAARLESRLLVDDVMRRWPQAVAAFLGRRMKCVGCPFGVFHTIAQACEEHSLELAPFLAELERAIEASPASSPSLRQAASADADCG